MTTKQIPGWLRTNMIQIKHFQEIIFLAFWYLIVPITVYFLCSITTKIINLLPYNKRIIKNNNKKCSFCLGRVDYERIQAVGPDRAASEWLLRCGALVRYQGSEKWQQDYNGLPTGPLGKYKIEAINATESCIMYRGFDYLGNVDLAVQTIYWMVLVLFSCIKIWITGSFPHSVVRFREIFCFHSLKLALQRFSSS